MSKQNFSYPSFRFTLKPLCVSISVALLSTSVFAQTENSDTTNDSHAVSLPTLHSQSHTNGYSTSQATSHSTRGANTIKETPQSIHIITNNMIKDMNAGGSIESALSLGGIGKGNNFLNSITSYNVRGFNTSEYYQNGFAGNSGFGNPSPDSVSIESIEVLKGPAAQSFGRGDPGGVFNIITKRAQNTAAYQAGINADNQGTKRATFDATGPISDTLMYRTTAAVEKSETFRDYSKNDKQFIAPSFIYQPNESTEILFDVAYTHLKNRLDRGVPTNTNSTSLYLSDPVTGLSTTDNLVNQLRLKYQINPKWHIETGLQYLKGSSKGLSLDPGAINFNTNTVARTLINRNNNWNNKTVQTYLYGQFDTASIQHDITTGLEYREDDMSSYQESTAGPILNLNNPTYNIPLTGYSLRFNRFPNSHIKNSAISLQDEITFNEHLKAFLGLRYENYRAQSKTLTTTGTTYSKTKADNLTPRLGLSYNITPSATAYINYSESFTPNAGTDRQNQNFKPERGQSWETGLKFDLLDNTLQVTAAAFHINKENVLTADPLNQTFPNATQYKVTAGEVRSQGFELNINGQINPNLRVSSYASYTDAKVTKDNTIAVGRELPNSAKFRAGLLSMYQFSGMFENLSIGTNLQYVSSLYSSTNTARYKLPSYTTVDLLTSYNINSALTAKFSVKNLFNKTYYDRPWTDTIVYPGAPITAQLSLDFKF